MVIIHMTAYTGYEFLLRLVYLTPPMSNNRPYPTTDPRLDGKFLVRPPYQTTFFVNITGLSNDPLLFVLFGPTPGRTATLVVVRLGGEGFLFVTRFPELGRT